MSISNLFYSNNYDLFANSLILSNPQPGQTGPTGPEGPAGQIEIIGSTGPITINISPNAVVKLYVKGPICINGENNVRINRCKSRH